MSYTQILSVVTVVDARAARPIERIAALGAALAELGAPHQLILVVDDPRAAPLAELRALTARQPDLQLLLLRHPVDHQTALIAGVENAIGDWVALLDLATDEPAVIGDMFRAVQRDGTEVALGHAAAVARAPLDAVASGLFHRAFGALHGFRLDAEAPSARLLSRAVVNQVLQHDAPLVALETLTASSGIRRSSVPLARVAAAPRPLAERVRSRWRALIGMGAAPLRIANLLCGLGALLAFAYSVYVVITYLVRDDVVPGWTTVSLMLSAMFMMLSLVLWLLGEYMVLLLDPGARRPRYEIAEELNSEVQTRRQRLNVESEG